MPEFTPGESKTAIAPITARPAGMSCQAELFLGPDELTKVASSGRVPFVSTGAAQSVSLPITMPSSPGNYKGFIDVFTGDFRFLAYQIIGDVVIAAAPVLPFTFSNVHCNQKNYPFYSSWKTIEWWCTITNPNNAVVTQTLSLMYVYIKSTGEEYSTRVWWTFELTLNPNEVLGFYYDGAAYGERNPSAYNGPDIGTGAHLRLWLRDEYGNESPKCTA